MTNRNKLPHPVVRSDGNPVQFKAMTNRLCPVCNPASDGARMGVVSDTTGTVVLECEHCAYNEYMKPEDVGP